MKVAKFGGSSMADAQQFQKVKQIILSDSDRKAVVVSAMGKGPHNPVKLTDQLIGLTQVTDEADYQAKFTEINQRIVTIADELKLAVNVEQLLTPLQSFNNHLSEAELVSRGEFITATLLSAYLGWPMLDAADFVTISAEDIDYQASAAKLNQLRKNVDHFIVPGFYGVNAQGKITLLQRGGGDTSGALVANLVDADTYENWTDTSGILQVDPRIIEHPRQIQELSFDELQELAYLGVQVFNSEAVQPVKMKGIPIQIKNTNQPQAQGTRVVLKRQHPAEITGVAGKKNQTVITLKQYQLNQNLLEIAGLLEKLKQQPFHFDYYQSGTDQINLVLNDIDTTQLCEVVAMIQAEIKLNLEIQVQSQVALVAIVSDALKSHPAMTGKFIADLDESEIKVNSVFQATNDIKVVFGVDNQDYQRTIAELYKQA
ncbi:aspartate kinase [Fructilactobacillus frigidiflavus]|uniref:aspartate kinase n=1 Tax=Fructilactobacillus frigidiflavus TaxID=3242688 RepID=UPI0037580934